MSSSAQLTDTVDAPTEACGFLSPLRTESWTPQRIAAERKDRQQFTLLEPLIFLSASHGAITVPPGFVTDFASIPRVAWAYLAPDDPCIEYPSVVHDYLYSARGRRPGARPLTRDECDGILAEAMAVCGARWSQRKLVYAAVRIGGGSHWRE